MLCSYCPNPVLVIIDVEQKELGIPNKAYYAVEEVKDVSYFDTRSCSFCTPKNHSFPFPPCVSIGAPAEKSKHLQVKLEQLQHICSSLFGLSFRWRANDLIVGSYTGCYTKKPESLCSCCI